MRSRKEHARQSQAAQPPVEDEERTASGSAIRDIPAAAQQIISESSDTQPTGPDASGPSGPTTGSSSGSESGVYRDVLVDCNSLVEGYRKGEITKAAVYIEIQSKLTKALGDDRARTDAAFRSFIATIESHDAEIGAAFAKGRHYDPEQRSPSPPVSVSDHRQPESDEEPAAKRVKVDESAYAWVRSRKDKQTVLRDTLSKTLKLIEAYTVDPKATKQSLVNKPDCPEFPDSEWKNIISGRAVNLDTVLSGQLSTTQDNLEIEKFGDLEISFGAVEPTKLVKNAGDWLIAWNRTVRAIIFAFPHQMQELTSYGEYIVNLFSVTHSSVHSQVVNFDKAVRKRVGSVRILNSPTSRNLRTSRSLTWIRSGYRSSPGPLKTITQRKESGAETGRKTNHVINGMTVNVAKRRKTADGYTSVTSAGKGDIKEETARSSESEPSRPKYMQRSVWTNVDETHRFSPTACCTLSDDPLPRPPPEEFENLDAITTIRDNPYLFKIITPINISRFESLLKTHLNKPFVQSMCTSFHEGFWPWAKTQKEDYPVTWDFSQRPPKSEREAEFLRNQRDVELEAERYSESFGTHLLPGMYSTPIHAIPKPRSEKLRLVNDHSAGSFSLNSMISRGDIQGAKMDSISDLVGALLRYRKDHPDKKLVLFKSDVSAAYQRLPLHPLWQVKQVVTVDDERHVDRCTSFGGRGSCRSYTSFMGLVIWIAIFVKLILDLFGYIDDNFSFDEEGNVLWYSPYGCYYPAKQTKLLELWDEINLPHDRAKQEY